MAYDVVESAGLNPATDTDTVLYTSTDQTVALVTVANMSTSTSDPSIVAIAHRRGGAALDDTMYKMRTFSLLEGDDRTIGPLMLSDGGIISVRADSTKVSFTMEGFSTS